MLILQQGLTDMGPLRSQNSLFTEGIWQVNSQLQHRLKSWSKHSKVVCLGNTQCTQHSLDVRECLMEKVLPSIT